MTRQMGAEFLGVGTDTVDETRLAAAKERQAEHVHTWHGEDATVVDQATARIDV